MTANVAIEQRTLSLLERLKDQERRYERISNSVARLGNDLEEAGAMQPALPSLHQEALAHVQDDVNAAQREIILDYRDHPVISAVLDGKTTVEAEAREVMKPYARWRKLLPHFKDNEYNCRVENLGQILVSARGYRTNGIFFPDNPVTGAVYGFVGVPLFIGLLNSVVITVGELASTRLEMRDVTEAMINNWGSISIGDKCRTAVIFSGAASYMGLVMLRSDLIPDAKYIDSRVKELI